MNDFEIWQNRECQALGITKEQHNKILELAEQLDSAFGYIGMSYGYLYSIIERGRYHHFTDIVSDSTQHFNIPAIDISIEKPKKKSVEVLSKAKRREQLKLYGLRK